jgi:hypothetical protein
MTVDLDTDYRVLTAALNAHPEAQRVSEFAEAARQLNDWHGVTELARWHGVEGPLFAMVARLDEPVMPPSLLRELRTDVARETVRTLFLKGRAREVCSALARADISVMALKGIALVERVYRDHSLRSMADIDLLVHRSDLERAYDVVVALCYHGPTEDHFRQGRRHAPELSDQAGASIVELHHHIINGTQLASIEPMWERASAATDPADEFLVPSLEDLIFHVASHFSGDRMSRTHQALRQLMDLGETLRVADATLDWDVVIREAQRFGHVRPLFFALFAAHELTGAAVPTEVLATLVPDGYTDEVGSRFLTRRILTTDPWQPLEFLAARQQAARVLWTALSPRRTNAPPERAMGAPPLTNRRRISRGARLLVRELGTPHAVRTDFKLNRLLRPEGPEHSWVGPE